MMVYSLCYEQGQIKQYVNDDLLRFIVAFDA